VKLTFAHGASLLDPDELFNAGLEGNARRAIDFFEGDKIRFSVAWAIYYAPLYELKSGEFYAAFCPPRLAAHGPSPSPG